MLVYDRTRSPLLTALAYASGYLPWIIGGLFLAGLADRYPRRAVMVTCDMARAVSLMGPLAVLTCAALVLTALRPDLAVSLVIFSLSALFGIYQIAAGTEFVARVPDERRAQAVGIASTGIVVGQGAGFIAADAAASYLGPAVVIALWGGAGAVAAVALTLRWRQLSPPGGRHAAGQPAAHVVTRAPDLRGRRAARAGSVTLWHHAVTQCRILGLEARTPDSMRGGNAMRGDTWT